MIYDKLLENWVMYSNTEPKIYKFSELKALIDSFMPDIPLKDAINKLLSDGIVTQTVLNEYRLTDKGLKRRKQYPLVMQGKKQKREENYTKTNPEEWLWFRKLCNYYSQCTEYDERGDHLLFLDDKCTAKTVHEGSSVFMIPKQLPYRWLSLPRSGTSKDIELTYTKDQTYAASCFMANRDEAETFIGYPIVGHRIKNSYSNNKYDVFFTPVCQVPAEYVYDSLAEKNTIKLRLDFKRAFLNPMWIEKSVPLEYQQMVKELEENSYKSRGILTNPIPIVDLEQLLPLALSPSYSISDTRCFDMVSPDQVIPKMKDSVNHQLFNTAVIFQDEALRYSKVLKKELNYIANEATDSELDNTALAYLFRKHPFEEEKSYRISVPFIDSNQEQTSAVELALNSHVAVVQGPPGTGKTQMAVNLIANSVFNGESVLFTSNNHQAINAIRNRADNLFENLPLVQFVSSAENKDSVTSWFDVDLNPFNDEIAYKQEAVSAQNDTITHSLTILSKLREKYDVWNDFYTGYVAAEKEYEDNIKRCKSILVKEYESDDLATEQELFDRELSLVKDKYSFWDKLFFRVNKLRKKREEDIAWLQSEFNRLYKETLSDFSYDTSSLKLKIDDAKHYCRKAAEAEKVLKLKYSELSSLPDWSSGYKEFKIDYEALKENGHEAFFFRYYNRLDYGYSDEFMENLKVQQKVIGEKGGRGFDMASSHSKKLRRQQQDDAYYEKLEAIKTIYKFIPAWASTLLSVSRAFPCIPGIVDQAIVDESSQCLPATIIPVLFRAKRVAVIGDENQFQPITSLKKKTHEMILKYNKMEDSDEPVYYVDHSAYDIAQYHRARKYQIMLKEHFRCSPDIANFINATVYDNSMRIRTNELSFNNPYQNKQAFEWIDVQDNINQEILEAGKRVKELADNNYKGSIGIITPLAVTAENIRKHLYDNNLLEYVDKCDTTYSFQGGEEDLIIFVLGLTSKMKHGQRWYVEESGKGSENLLNVSISRAKALLLVIGDKSIARSSSSRIIRSLANYNPYNNRKRLPVCESVYESMLVSALNKNGIEHQIQYPLVGRFLDVAIITDTCKIDVEVDGYRFHTNKNGTRKSDDWLRDNQIEACGWLVLRFWSYDLRDYMDECIKRIKETMATGTVSDETEWRAQLPSIPK